MPSPFPGMNPYLEQKSLWRGFHDRFVNAISDALAPQVDPYFFVEIEEYLFIHEPSAEERLRVGDSDVSLSRGRQNAKGAMAVAGLGAAVAAPRQVVVSTEMDVERHIYLEIINRESREVVTVIEVLSPTNKLPGEDRNHYLRKRNAILESKAHFVEIDLLRAGPKMPAEEAPACDYAILVSAHGNRPQAGYWPIPLRDPLPRIPVPLREPIPIAWLNLQEILHAVYDRAVYKNRIYLGQPEPPLSGDDLDWANSILKFEGINIS
jgi:hypothetical protein